MRSMWQRLLISSSCFVGVVFAQSNLTINPNIAKTKPLHAPTLLNPAFYRGAFQQPPPSGGNPPNQINPANQVKWPMPSCGGGVYAPASNTCVPPGTAANPAPPSGAFQFNNGNVFNTDQQYAMYDFNKHRSQMYDESLQRPRADIRANAYAGGADPTGTNDAYPSLLAAYNDVTNTSTNPFATPSIYIPAGKYKFSQALRITTSVEIDGDGVTTTIIAPPPGYQNVFTLVSTPTVSFKNFQVLGNGAYMGSANPGNYGNVFELNWATDVNIQDIIVSNWGGRVINNAGDSERGYVRNLKIAFSNIGLDSSFQSNEWNYDTITGMFLGKDLNNHCFHPGINCDPNTYLQIGPNTDVCSKYPSWAANTKYQRGMSICDPNGNIETADAEGTSGATIPTFPTGEFAKTCDGNTAMCALNPIPYYIPDYSSPVEWINRKLDTPWIPDPIPFWKLSGNRVNMGNGSIKSTGFTAGVMFDAQSNSYLHDLYIERVNSTALPTINPGVIIGSGDPMGTVTTSTVAPAVTSFTVANALFMFESVLGTDADANAGRQPRNIFFACPDSDPQQVGVACTTPGFAGFTRDQFEAISVKAFSLQSFRGYVNARCQGGSSPGCGPNGFNWPVGTLVIDPLSNSSATAGSNTVEHIHNSSVGGRGQTGYFPIMSMTGHTVLPDGNWISLVPGAERLGAMPDGRIYTPLGASKNGWGGNPSSVRAVANVSDNMMNSAFDMYINSGGVGIPLYGLYYDNGGDVGVNAQNLPNGIYAGWTLGNNISPFVQFGFYNNTFAGGKYERTLSGITMIPGTINTLTQTRDVTTLDGWGQQGGKQSAGGYCLMDFPAFGSTSTHPLNQLCVNGSPNSQKTQGFEYDTWNGSAWVNQFGVSNAGAFTGALAPLLALTNRSNNFTAAQSVNGVYIGLLSNWTANSSVFSPWTTTNGTTPTYTTGQLDPWNYNTATKVTASGYGQLSSINATTPLLQNTNYITCTLAQGAAGGETIKLAGLGNVYTITTAWSSYCTKWKTGTTNLTRTGMIEFMTAENVFVAGVWTIQGGDGVVATFTPAPPYLPIQGTNTVTTPLPLVVAGPYVLPTLSANGQRTIPANQVCTGTFAAGYYCDPSTGQWTALTTVAQLTTASITPASVPSASCADQTFTLTGATTASSFLTVKPPAALGGLSVTAINNGANSVILHFCDVGAAPSTPPAGIYTVPAIN